MGDVPPFTYISKAYNQTQLGIEIVRGVASNSKVAFQLDGAITNYLNFRDDNITDAILETEFKNLFTIRCPPSLNNLETTLSIVYAEEFESASSYDQTTYGLKDVTFCGRGALRNANQYMIYGNTLAADYMCFAYKIKIGNSMTMNLLVESDGNPGVLESIPMNLNADSNWHYKCLNLRDTLEQHSFMYLAVNTFVVTRANLSTFTPYDILVDTVTLRDSEPMGYEDESTLLDTDHSGTGHCTYPSCILDDNNEPICGFNGNNRLYCQNSSIEGVRRLLPKYELLDNLFQVRHSQVNHTIDITFRYKACLSPTLARVIPTAVSF